MGKSTRSRKASEAIISTPDAGTEPTAVVVAEEQSVAVATPPEHAVAITTVQPTGGVEGRRRKSLVQSPVQRVWFNCISAVEAARAAGKPLPGRKALHEINMADGIAYYTSRTQVQLYLKASNNGATMPRKLPKGLTIN